MPLTVGTAGHIDHGKTWLVRALTGKDTDRLPEEQRRGISIDLGYAPLELPDGRRLSLVDVPGHERFVRNMVAGATGIDLFLLVIDAAEGARPQTLEHLAILRLLGIGRGVVAVTKADAVDEETLELALAEAAELVPEAGGVAVSAKTGAGLDELRAALAAAAGEAERTHADGPTRLYVDRVFTLRGIGTVVTGHALVGHDRRGRRAARRAGRASTRGSAASRCTTGAVERAEAGQRVAVALPGIERDRLARGDALVAPGAYPVTYRLDVVLEELGDDSRPRSPSISAPPTCPPGCARRGRYAQLRLERPLVAARGDRVVLRTSDDRRRRRRARPPPAPPARPRSGSSGSSAATRARSSTSRCGRRRCATSASCQGVERAGELGLLRATGWTSSAPTSARDSRPPTRATRGSTRRPRRGRPRSCRCSASSGAARASTCPGATATADGRRGAARRAGGGRARRRSRSRTTRPCPRCSSRRAGSSGSATGSAVGAEAYEPRPRGARRRVPVGGQDHARAFPRPARRRPADGAAPARALRRRRSDAPDRRRARPAP